MPIEINAMDARNVVVCASRVHQGFPKVEVNWLTTGSARTPKVKAECATPFFLPLKKPLSDGVERINFSADMAVKLVLANDDVETSDKVTRRYLPAHV